MNGSRTILVHKRGGGCTERFQVEKLRLCFWRALGGRRDTLDVARCLADAVAIYLRRQNRPHLTSRALLEIAIRALRQTGHGWAAEDLEHHHRRRQHARGRLKITDPAIAPAGTGFPWDRQWVTRQIEQRWSVGHDAAAAISADIERELLAGRPRIERQALLDLLDERVDNYGLAPWCLLASMPAG